LFHELGHVFLHLINNSEAEFIDVADAEINSKKDKEEKEADNYALNSLIEEEAWTEFYDSHEHHSDPVIKRFSKEIKVHPAIILGRICYDEGNYARRTRISHEIM
jgi:HTH-type transcriptional regulator/antitoxin HigA